MIGTVAKRLRAQALNLTGHARSKATYVSTVKRYFTGALNDKDQPIVEKVKKITLRYTGYRRVYQALKHRYMQRA